MWRTLWTSLVVGSLSGLILYFGYLLFQTSTEVKPVDPYEALLQQPVESFPEVSETGTGKLAIKEAPPKIIKEPPSVRDINPGEVVGFENDIVEPKDVPMSEKDSVAQLENIQKELDQLPGGPESAPTRAVLLNNASALNLDDQGLDQVHELAMDELLQAGEEDLAMGDQSTSFAYFLPVLAHEVALKTALDADDAMSLTIDGLTVHRDPGVRYSLVRQFVTRYPDLELQLREELFIRNIQAGIQAN